ncbi:3'-5' exonuclease [Anaerolineales bacterium HSG25]|nr:3'-5' exonuclease [Anaerolineales bacterium HSG25]
MSRQQQARDWANAVLADEQAIIIDTETTGLSRYDEVVEIGIINSRGETVLNTLVKPQRSIHYHAWRVHGINTSMCADAPTFAQLYDQLTEIFTAASRIIIYNVSFDKRLLNQSCQQHGLSPFDFPPHQLQCAMKMYAQLVGRSRRLNGGHRALGDCIATLKLIKSMS